MGGNKSLVVTAMEKNEAKKGEKRILFHNLFLNVALLPLPGSKHHVTVGVPQGSVFGPPIVSAPLRNVRASSANKLFGAHSFFSEV